jgi:peptidoglycan hydrolase-like protein with peptidoglycan-binding domain
MYSPSAFHNRHLSFTSNDGATRYGGVLGYACLWGPVDGAEGARDSNSNNSVTPLINALLAADFAPEGVTKRLTSGDNKFGSKVTAAVKKFQQARGMIVDGIVGPGTWKALNNIASDELNPIYVANADNCPYKAGQFPYGTKGPERPADAPPATTGGGGLPAGAPPPPAGDTKFYQEPWFLPVAVGGGVLLVALGVAFLPRLGKGKRK